VSEPLTAESLAYWHREVTDRHNGDSPWRDEDVMVLVARFLATLEAAARATPTPDTLLLALWRVAEAARAASGILDALDAQAGPPPGPEHLVTVTTEAWTDSIRPRVKVLREALADLDATREEMP